MLSASQTTERSLTGGQGDNWNDLLKEVISFDSVEEFWGVIVSDSHVAYLPNDGLTKLPL